MTGNHQFLVAIEHVLHRLARLLSQRDTGDAPRIGAELRTKAAAHVLTIDVNLIDRQAGCLGHLARIARHVLR